MDSAILDVVIGLVFVYFTLSMVCSAVGEWWTQRRNTRGRSLKERIGRLIHGDSDKTSLVDDLYKHKLIQPLMNEQKMGGERRLPSFIPARTFSRALLDLLAGAESGGARSGQALRDQLSAKAAGGGADAHAAGVVLGFHDATQGQTEAILQSIDSWFDDAMARMGGEYKRKMRRILFFCAVFIVVATDADTLRILEDLTHNPVYRQAVVSLAEEASTSSPAETAMETVKTQLAKIEPLLGWTTARFTEVRETWGTVFTKLFGLLLTALAASLGAPFWFDVLQKLLKLKKTVQEATKPADGEAEAAGESPPAPPPDEYREGLVGFRAHTGKHNGDNAYWLGRCAALAYESKEDIGTVTHGWKLGSEFLEDAATDTQVFLAGDDRIVIVAFRGTESLKDGLSDADFKLVPWPGGGMVHRGFKEALDSIWDQVVASLEKLRTGGQSIWVTGHSLGGALAALCVARLLDEGLGGNTNVSVHGLYTIGQPRVGDEEFSRLFDARMKDRTFRYVNNRDIVPRVPFRAMGFRDVGHIAYFDEAGRLHMDPGMWYRALDTVEVDTEKLPASAKEAVGDHGSANYVALLESVREQDGDLWGRL